jgi:hypothetical protein
MNEGVFTLENIGVLNLVFLIIAVTGLFLAFYFYYKSKKEKRPVYNLQTIRLIKKNVSSINKLQILYKESNVENLSVTKFSFWNTGRGIIRKSDFIESDTLTIYHSGESNEDIKMKGSFIGAMKIKEGTERNKLQHFMFKNKQVLYIQNALQELPYIIGFPLGLLFVFLYGPFVIVIGIPLSILDWIYDKFFNNSPKFFHLNEIKV